MSETGVARGAGSATLFDALIRVASAPTLHAAADLACEAVVAQGLWGRAAFVMALPLILGVVSMWLYAAIRPRYGPGPTTAVAAWIAIWIISQVLPLLYWSQLLGLPIRLVVLNLATTLVVGVAATLTGAWLYKE